MSTILLLNAKIVNEGHIVEKDIYIKNGLIDKLGQNLSSLTADKVIDCAGKYILPGAIDDQVHFREPGLTHKANIYTEARAAVAGGVTSFMEMPNTVPSAVTFERLESKYQIASQTSLANYSFYIGVTNSDPITPTTINPKTICGVKIFMGSSTGDMLVDNQETLEYVFANSPTLIAIHSEDDKIVKRNKELFQKEYGDTLTTEAHEYIRNVEACYKKTEYAVALAKKHNTRLHVLHISTMEELEFFKNDIPLAQKKITAEACVHHLWFDSSDYKKLSNLIKCNPSIKEAKHKAAIFDAVLDNRIDVIATDHAPHTLEEKMQTYMDAPSGLPLVQHSLLIMMEFYKKGRISLEKIVEKMAHHPAILFQIEKRGYIREGYFADLVVVDLNAETEVRRQNLFYKCGWSPLEGVKFRSAITHTLVNGHVAYENGKFDESKKGERLSFDR